MARSFKFYGIFLVLMLAFGCKSEKRVMEGFVIDIVDLKKVDNIEVTDTNYISSYSIVKLESSSKSLIQDIDQMEIFEGRIYIRDRNQTRLLVFGFDGKYIRDIGMRGRANNEYQALSAFYINPEKRTVNVADPLTSRIISYDLDGRYIGSKEVKGLNLGPISSMRYFGESEVVCFANPNIFDDRILYILNEEDYSIKDVVSTRPFAPDVGAYSMATQPYSVVSGNLHFVSLFQRTIKSYSGEKPVDIIYTIDDGKQELTDRQLQVIAEQNANSYISVGTELMRSHGYSAGLQNLFESDRFIFCSSLLSLKNIVWDKHNKIGSIIAPPNNNLPGLNDLSYSEGNTFVKIWKPDQIKRFMTSLSHGDIPHADSYDAALEKLGDYDPDQDNPVLLVFQMKN
ncbi:MAG: 6-bladed beta-propeller [Rikenellaceae bacterium]|nr:6-bladed beta-propeller [Rikenellaceae bacterium]MCL2691868.1 6-bladed beta-propeller [Rikenellaceae bacterium]